jgi:hypothetical protein
MQNLAGTPNFNKLLEDINSGESNHSTKINVFSRYFQILNKKGWLSKTKKQQVTAVFLL